MVTTRAPLEFSICNAISVVVAGDYSAIWVHEKAGIKEGGRHRERHAFQRGIK